MPRRVFLRPNEKFVRARAKCRGARKTISIRCFSYIFALPSAPRVEVYMHAQAPLNWRIEFCLSWYYCYTVSLHEFSFRTFYLPRVYFLELGRGMPLAKFTFEIIRAF